MIVSLPPTVAQIETPAAFTPIAVGTPSPYGPISPATILQRYAAALAKLREPQAFAFDYTLDQAGPRTGQQTHRVFRSGNDERDETLTVDGKRLSPPKIRVFRGRRNRYAISSLAPRPEDYTFTYIGSRRDGHHEDYLFRLTPKTSRPFAITSLTIDGVRYLPLSMDFATTGHAGAGTMTFGSNGRWWVPYSVSAHATVATVLATEKLTFYTYRFPSELPPATFGIRSLPPRPSDLPPASDATLLTKPTAGATARPMPHPDAFTAPLPGPTPRAQRVPLTTAPL